MLRHGADTQPGPGESEEEGQEGLKGPAGHRSPGHRPERQDRRHASVATAPSTGRQCSHAVNVTLSAPLADVWIRSTGTVRDRIPGAGVSARRERSPCDRHWAVARSGTTGHLSGQTPGRKPAGGEGPELAEDAVDVSQLPARETETVIFDLCVLETKGPNMFP